MDFGLFFIDSFFKSFVTLILFAVYDMIISFVSSISFLEIFLDLMLMSFLMLPVQHWTNSTYLWISRWNCCLALSNPKIWHGKFENISLNFGRPFWIFPKNRKWISTPIFFILTTIQAEHVPLKFRKCLNYISSSMRKTSFRWPF